MAKRELDSAIPEESLTPAERKASIFQQALQAAKKTDPITIYSKNAANKPVQKRVILKEIEEEKDKQGYIEYHHNDKKRMMAEAKEDLEVAQLAEDLHDASHKANNIISSKNDVYSSTSLRERKLGSVPRHEALARISGKLANVQEMVNNANDAVKASQAVRQPVGLSDEAPGAKGNTIGTSSDDQRLIYKINPEDSTLTAIVKEMLIRMEVRTSDIFALVHNPDFPWLSSDNQAWNFIYALRKRSSMTFETMERWVAMLGCGVSIQVTKMSTDELRAKMMERRKQEAEDVMENTDPAFLKTVVSKKEVMNYVYNGKPRVDLTSLGRVLDPEYSGNLISDPELAPYEVDEK